MQKKNNTRNKILTKYTGFKEDKFILIADASMGVYAKSVFELSKISSRKKDFFASILNISSKTLDRYEKSKKKLNPVLSEHVLKLFALYEKGFGVFGNIDSFNSWLEKPSYGLLGNNPIDFLSTSSGIDLIMEELSRIEFGDLA